MMNHDIFILFISKPKATTTSNGAHISRFRCKGIIGLKSIAPNTNPHFSIDDLSLWYTITEAQIKTTVEARRKRV